LKVELTLVKLFRIVKLVTIL